MSIADKLTTIAGNMQKVYEAGQAAGSGGENALQYISQLKNTFQYTTFPDGYELLLDIPQFSGETIQQVAASTTKGLKKLTIKCGRSDITLKSLYGFYACNCVEEIDLSQFCDTEVVKVKDAHYLFYACGNLHTIVGVLDLTGCANLSNAFPAVTSLVNVRFLAGSIESSIGFNKSYNLSVESVQSIADGLADLTGKTTQTLTMPRPATVVNKLTDVQEATITTKNWTLVYI